MHRAEGKGDWEGMTAVWASPQALYTATGNLRTREEGLSLLLQMALAYADFDSMSSMPDNQKPLAMKRSCLDAVAGQVLIFDAVQLQLATLKSTFEGRSIPPRPDATRRVFNVRPDLRINLVRTITQLRQKTVTRTPLQEKLYRAHLRESEVREQILRNIAVRQKRKRADVEAEEVARTADTAPAAPAAPAAEGDNPEPRAAKRTRLKKRVPYVPPVPLAAPLPPRAARSPLPENLETTASARASARRRNSRGGTSKRKSMGTGSTAGSTRVRKEKVKAKPKAKPRKRRPSSVRFKDVEDMFDDDSAEDSDAGEADEEDFTELLAQSSSAATRPRPRPRPVYAQGSAARRGRAVDNGTTTGGSRGSSPAPITQTSDEGEQSDRPTSRAARAARAAYIASPAAGPSTPRRGGRAVRAARDESPSPAPVTPRTPRTPRHNHLFVLLTPRAMLANQVPVEDALPGPLSRQLKTKK